jgi:hypothetical protein
MARAVSGIASSRRGHLAVRRTRRAASSIVGETQAGQQDHCFLDSLYRAAVATHAAMRLRVFMQGEASVALVRVRGSRVNWGSVRAGHCRPAFG